MLADRQLVQVVGGLSRRFGVVVVDRAVQFDHFGQASMVSKRFSSSGSPRAVAILLAAPARRRLASAAAAGPPGSPPTRAACRAARDRGRRQPRPRAEPARTAGSRRGPRSGRAASSASSISSGAGIVPPRTRPTAPSIRRLPGGRRRSRPSGSQRRGEPTHAARVVQASARDRRVGGSRRARAAGRYLPATGRQERQQRPAAGNECGKPFIQRRIVGAVAESSRSTVAGSCSTWRRRSAEPPAFRSRPRPMRCRSPRR